MADTDVSDEQLSLLLQASRDMAFRQLGEAGTFVPFATRASADGEIDFVRLADGMTDEPMDTLYVRTQDALVEQAREGQILAAAMVANVGLPEPHEGFEAAIHIHVEAPGYSRVVLAPYRVEQGEGEGAAPALIDGELFANDAAPTIFAD